MNVAGTTSVSPSDCRRLWYAVVASAVFLLAALVQGAVRPGYDAWQQSISALSLGPSGWVQDLFFLLLGTALLSTVPVWWRVLAGGVGARAYPILTALTAVSLIAAAWVPQDPAPGYDPEQLGHALPTTTGLIHLALAGVGAGGSCASMFVMAARFASMPDWRRWALFTRAAGALTILCVIIYGVWSRESSGLAGAFERMVVVIPGVWGYAVVARLTAGSPISASFHQATTSPPDGGPARSMLAITHALTTEEVATVRLLIEEYQRQLGVDLSYQDFEDEVRDLPGAYAPPRGRLLLATHADQPVGCIAFRDAGGGRAEMKRLYVRPSGRGLGVGRELVAHLVSEARDAGYREVVLDTLPTMQSAQRLYEQFGFRDIPAYRSSPIPGTRYLALTIA